MAGKRSIGFVGAGIMGFHMARRLAESRHRVTAWNRTRAKADRLAPFGVTVVGAASEAGEGADVVIVMVLDGASTDEVILGGGAVRGLLDTMPDGSSLIVMSSIPMETAQRQAKAAGERGVAYLDAPVSGGEIGARDGTLAIMVGGEQARFEALQDVFMPLGRATLVGPAGAGSLAKLANQIIVGNTMASVAEALLLVERGGGDAGAVVEALKGGFADSRILQHHGRRMVDRIFKPGGFASLHYKDSRMALDLAAKLSLELPLTQQTLNIYKALIDLGFGDLDSNATYLELRRRKTPS